MQRSLQLAQDAGARYVAAQALRANAQLALSRGEGENALRMIQESISALSDTATRLELGRSLLVRGQIQRGLADPQAAAEDWRAGLDLFEGLGALALADAAREMLEQIEMR